jgi:hypothetical protein
MWDWFDGGLSTYWYPGVGSRVVEDLMRRAPPGFEEGSATKAMGRKDKKEIFETRKVGRGGEIAQEVDISPLIAPWRRIM